VGELQIGNMSIAVTKKNIKNMYIRVLPPDGLKSSVRALKLKHVKQSDSM